MNSVLVYSFWFIEAAAAVLFIKGFFHCSRESRARGVEFVMIFVYGIVLEELDMRFFGTYQYGPHFLLTIGQVPLCIAMLWAVIIAGAMRISDSLPLPPAVRPFADALLALWLDLAVDAVAIRLGYWSWKIPLTSGWFGVPAGNLYAWMWVAFLYSAFARMVRGLEEKNQFWILGYAVVPVVAYAALFIELMILGSMAQGLGFAGPTRRLVMVGFHVLIFSLIVKSSWSLPHYHQQHPVHPFWLRSRMLIHCFALLAGMYFGIFRQLPALAAVALAVVLAEMLWTQVHVRTAKS